MELANMFARRIPPRRSRPARLEDLRGPGRGVILLPRSLAWPGMRECDVSDAASRRGVYAMILARGTREETIRLVNGELLVNDWPLIKQAVEPGLQRRWERVLEPAASPAGPTASPAGPAAR